MNKNRISIFINYKTFKVYCLKFTTYYSLLFFLLLSLLFPANLIAADKLIFNHINIKDIKETSVIINWETAIPSTGQIKYGFNMLNLNQIMFDVSNEKEHTIVLNGLKKGTLYYFRIISISSNQTIKSELKSFKTGGIPELMIIANNVYDIKKNTVKIAWKFNRQVLVILKYLPKGSTTPVIHKTDKFNHSGTFIVKNLNPKTKYMYVISGETKDNKKIESPVCNFETVEWNIALNKKVYGTFKTFLTEDPYFDVKNGMLERITDGKMNYFNGMAVSGDLNLKNQYVTIDLEKEFPIEAIEVFWRALSYSYDYSVLLSIDNNNWETIASKITAKKGNSRRGEKGDPIIYNHITCNGKTARYIKVFIKKGSKYYVKHANWKFVQIMEIKVFPSN